VKDFVPVRVEVTSTDTTSPPKSDLDLWLLTSLAQKIWYTTRV
jgi:hypothetical protein